MELSEFGQPSIEGELKDGGTVCKDCGGKGCPSCAGTGWGAAPMRALPSSAVLAEVTEKVRLGTVTREEYRLVVQHLRADRELSSSVQEIKKERAAAPKKPGRPAKEKPPEEPAGDFLNDFLG